MLRFLLSSFAVLSLCAVSMLAAGEKDKKDTKEAKGDKCKCTITKVDPKAGTIAVKMKDKEGKEVTKTFKLTEDVHYFDSTGKAVAIEVFESGNEVLIVEIDGKLKEVRKEKTTKTTTDK